MNRKHIGVIGILLIMLTACTGTDASDSRAFNYPGMKWGATMQKVIKDKGEPDIRTDEIEVPEGEEPPVLIDFYYYDQPILEDKYKATEQFLFDEKNELGGVIDLVDVGELNAEGTNRDEIVGNIKKTHLDMKAYFTELYGEPAAEYTAYRQDDTYVTDELLDLDKENAVICASRWDGDNYRYLYVISFLNSLELDVRYIPHSEEEIKAAEERENNEATEEHAN